MKNPCLLIPFVLSLFVLGCDENAQKLENIQKPPIPVGTVQVAIFGDHALTDSLDKTQSKINEWFVQNTDIEIVQILQSQSGKATYSGLIVSIYYKRTNDVSKAEAE